MSEQLLQQTKQDAFETGALAYFDALHNVAVYLTRDPDEARDLVQETYLRAYRTFDSFQDGTNGKAWLFTIMYSILSNRWRRDRRSVEEPLQDDFEDRFAAAVDQRQIERDLIAGLDRSTEVETALAGLSPEYRGAVLLVDVEELTYEEAAAVLECPVGTVRSRLARGRKALFVALEDYARQRGVLTEN